MSRIEFSKAELVEQLDAAIFLNPAIWDYRVFEEQKIAVFRQFLALSEHHNFLISLEQLLKEQGNYDKFCESLYRLCNGHGYPALAVVCDWVTESPGDEVVMGGDALNWFSQQWRCDNS